MGLIHTPGNSFNFDGIEVPVPEITAESASPSGVVVGRSYPGNRTYVPYQAPVAIPTVKQIVDTTDLSNHGVVLFRQSDLQDIFVKSGPNAKDNEFQVHYWALTLRMLSDDSSFLDIAIPTCFFNYPQQITSAHIDFEMSDVSDTSDQLLPLHNHLIQDLLSTDLISALETRLGIKVELISQHLGSIHRHPGSSAHQAFSGTDYGKDPSSHGIVYPFQTAKLDASFAGIMAIDSGICKLAHNEYRIASGELGVDIKYTKGRCLALVIDDMTTVSKVESILGKTVATHYSKENNSVVSDNIATFFVNWYKEVLKVLTPSTVAINPDYVTKKAYVAAKPYVYGSYYNDNESWKRPSIIETSVADPDDKDLLPYSKSFYECNKLSKKEAIRWLSKICLEVDGHCDISAFKKLTHAELVESILQRQQDLREKKKAQRKLDAEIEKPIVFPTEDKDIVIKFDDKYTPKEDFSIEYKRTALRDYVAPYIVDNASNDRIEELFEQYIP